MKIHLTGLRGRQSKRQGGFAILEAVLAVAICGIMATAIVVAMQRIANLSFEAKRESALSRIIHNELMFAATSPRMAEGKSTKQIEEWDVELETIISPLEGLVNQDGQEIGGLFQIEVNAVWWADGDYVNRSAETWRHGDMYVR